MKTVMEVVTAMTDYLAQRSVESPRLNAELLVAHVLKKKRLDLYLEFDRPLSEAELEPLRGLLRKRGSGIPLQHLLGTVEFHGRVFRTDARALIPRPETEALMELILKEPLPENPRFLDVGTGSGIIALTLAGELPGARGVALDLSPDALALARENGAQLDLADRVTWIQSDLLNGLDAGERFDLVVANLPYIASDEIAALSREVQHDPRLALDGGPRGTEIIERLIDEIRPFLNPGALLALEIGHDQAEHLGGVLQQQHYHDVRAKADYQEILRFLLAQHG
ncbi:MAG TPA: peptide chain release factor N(5)-glutamine methyltransferase [Chthoniobacteraceae bacterium]|nr:peptide chain release factor N(5)-glutamine methyltransferase [Chthoniobacteraceae bacterium]